MEEQPNFDAEIEDENPSRELADLLQSQYGEAMGLDNQTCEEIANMPFPEAFETSYSYLTQAGVDADEALSHFIQEPEE